MSVDLDTLLKIIPVLISLGTIVVVFFTSRRKDVDKRFDAVADRMHEGSKRMDRHDGRLQALEQAVGALPGKDHLHALQLQMAEMAGSLREMSAVMEGNQKIMQRLETIVSRHEDHLLEGRK